MGPTFLEVDRRCVRRALLALIAIFSIASLLVQIALYPLDRDSVAGLVPLFNANGEANIPSYYSALALLACGTLFAVIGAAERAASASAGRWWAGLAVLAGFASLDEAATLHETLGAVIQRGFSPGGYLYYVWVVPAALVVLVAALAYRPFVARLDASLRRALTGGVGLWVGSALLLELVESRLITSSHGFPTFEQAVVGSLQETGEMLGALVVLDGLLRYLAEREVRVLATVGKGR